MRLPAAARADRIDLLHFPANSVPAWRSTPSVVTVHDLIPLRVDGECDAAEQRKFVRGVRRAVRGATRIIAVSQATRDDLHDEFSVPLEKISVVHWAPDSRIAARACPQAATSARQKYDLRHAWLIGFSGASRRKNAPALIDAMAGLSPDQRNDLDLVLVGCEPASFRERLEETARRAGVAEHCRFMGFVPPDDIAGLLGGARGLVMPSLYEGFGLPILDAFALGVPVVTSDTSSMPEVAGEAALYCNPHDPLSITRAIERLLDRRTAARLVRAGRERVARFTWQRTAEAMCEVYERCLCETSRRRPATSGVGVAGLVEECIE
jgi:glycosyltransferase involved in cell wall biosynthesis